jgi:Ca2+-binding EF-hand superfamily protein
MIGKTTMNGRAGVVAVLVAVLLAVSLPVWAGAAAEKPAATTKPAQKTAKLLPKPPEVMKEAVDPFNPIKERARFFTAAGKDSELAKDEFAAARGKKDSFVRKYDDFDRMLPFDKDKNGSLDWFEARAYREDLRKRVFAAFDANKDGKLIGEERDKANRLLASGRVPAAPSRGGGVFGGLMGGGPGPDAEAIKRFDKNGDGRISGDERREMFRARIEQQQAEALAKFDANDDGKLDEKEQQALREDRQNRIMVRMFDKDRDGKFDEKETAEMEAALAKWREQRAEWEVARAALVKKHDKDGDGQLTGEERRAAWRDAREQWASKAFDADGDGKLSEQEAASMKQAQASAESTFKRWRADWTKEHDADGDGELSETEREAAFTKLREEGRKLRDAWQAKWDVDKDGQLSEAERGAMREAVQTRVAEMRKELDTDGDGRITGQEATAFFEKLQEAYDTDGDGVLSGDEARTMIRDQMSRFGGGGGTR